MMGNHQSDRFQYSITPSLHRPNSAGFPAGMSPQVFFAVVDVLRHHRPVESQVVIRHVRIIEIERQIGTDKVREWLPV